MEEIIIKEIDKKDSGLVIVKYNGNREATLNTKWQSQEVDYLEHDVGVGGRVKCEVVQKGQYTNITKVDMASGVKGNTAMTASEKIVDKPEIPQETRGLLMTRDISIGAQSMVKSACSIISNEDTKGWSANDIGERVCTICQELLAAYKVMAAALSEI